MNEFPIISVVIPTYNRAQIIVDTINSVINQTYENIEIIIVDDDSSDNTFEVIKNINDCRIKYIKLEKNSKGTQTRNVGIEASIGEYIAFLDSDDIWLPEKLEKQLNLIKQYSSESVLCFTKTISRNKNLEVKYKNDPIIMGEDIMEYIFLKNNNVQTSSYLLKSNVAKIVKFDPNLKKHQDWDFCLRLQNNGVKFICLNEYLTIWNDDTRKDRISNNNSYNNSMNWFNNIKQNLTTKAQYAFLTRAVGMQLINEKRYIKAFSIFMKSYFCGAINLITLIQYILKMVVPTNTQIKLKYFIKNILERKMYENSND